MSLLYCNPPKFQASQLEFGYSHANMLLVPATICPFGSRKTKTNTATATQYTRAIAIDSSTHSKQLAYQPTNRPKTLFIAKYTVCCGTLCTALSLIVCIHPSTDTLCGS